MLQVQRLVAIILFSTQLVGCEKAHEVVPLVTIEQALFGTGHVIHALAVGSEYEWEFFVPGEDGKLKTADDKCLGSELWLPPNRPVQLRLESHDFVYTFLQPDLQINEMISRVRRLQKLTLFFLGRRGARWEARCLTSITMVTSISW